MTRALEIAKQLQEYLQEYWNEGDPEYKASDLLRKKHEALKVALEALNITANDCEHLHHSKKDQHGWDSVCPVEGRIQAAISQIKELL